MRDWEGNEPSESAFRRLLNALTQSAEYAVAAALLAVCLIVAATWWLRSNRKPEPAVPLAEVAAQTSPQAAADESAQLREEEESAVRDLQQNLEARASEAERRRQTQLQAEEEARRRAEQAREKEAQQARIVAEEKTRATPKPPPAASGTTVAKAAPASPSAPAAPAAAASRTVIRPATVDWSTCKRPEYPPRSVERREEGVTVLQLSIAADGRVLNSKVAESSGFDPLDQRALRAVSKCTFKPASTDGVPEASSTQVRFAWKLGK